VVPGAQRRGAVIGTGQWLVARRLLGDPRAWIPVTAAGMGVGLLVGAWVVGYGTSLGELALMGDDHRGRARRRPGGAAPLGSWIGRIGATDGSLGLSVWWGFW